MRLLPLAAAALLLAACSGSSSAPKSEGEAVYKALNCRACHKIGGEGAGRGGPDLTMVGFRKSATWLDVWLKDPQAWKRDTLMPNPHLSDKARAQIVEYLSKQAGQAWGDKRPWNDASLKTSEERGLVVFAKAGCIGCHGRGGAGGYPNNNVQGGQIPALLGVSQKFTKDELRAKIKRGVVPEKKDPKGEDPLLRMPAWGEKLSDAEIDAVVEYLWTLKPGANAPEW